MTFVNYNISPGHHHDIQRIFLETGVLLLLLKISGGFTHVTSIIPHTSVCIRLPHFQLSVIILFGVNRHYEDSEVLTEMTM